MIKFPWIKQLDSKSCGIACLSMICRYYGKIYSFSYLESICGKSNIGVSFLDLSKGANIIGFKAKAKRISINGLKRIKDPCIVHYKSNHFVVLYKYKSNKFYISDPQKGKYRIDEVSFGNNCSYVNTDNYSESLINVLFIFPENLKNNEYSKINSFGFILKYCKKFKFQFLTILWGLILACILELILPFLTQAVVDVGISNRDINFVWLILLGELMIVVGRASIEFVRRWITMHISMRVNVSLISDFFIKLLELPISFFETRQLGDLLQRVGDHSRVQNFLTNQTVNIIFYSLSLIVLGLMLIYYNLIIFLIFCFGSILYGIWITFFLKRRKIIDYELFEKQSKNQGKTYQFITSIQEIKLQGCKEKMRWDWEDVQAEMFDVQLNSLKLQQSMESGGVLINELKNIFITVFAANAVISGEMTLGGMLAVQYIVGQLNSPIEQIITFLYSLQDVRISLERINEIHERENEVSSSGLTNEISLYPDYQVRNISFSYSSDINRFVIKNMSFDIPNSKITAIVGASGSGKTTLIKLLLGFYSDYDGEIIFCGQSLKCYNIDIVRESFGVVLQDSVIFSDTIKNNIAIGSDQVDMIQLINASKIANIEEMVNNLPQGYDTIIGRDGLKLSQGQRQRILIARAIYKDPKLIILDEATNSLDSNNEKIIINNLEKYFKGKTVIVIAHRLSTVVVMDDGQIKEIGNHQSLLYRKGYYYNLVQNQLNLNQD